MIKIKEFFSFAAAVVLFVFFNSISLHSPS